MAGAWGVSTGYPQAYTTAFRNDYYLRIAAAGFTKVRFDYDGLGAGGQTDLHVNSALAAGLDVLLIILGTNADATATYTARSEACVNFFGSRVSEYQLTNEPNLRTDWTPETWAAKVKPSYAAIKAIKADAHVMLGSIAQWGNDPLSLDPRSPQRWLERVYTAEGNAWFDSVSVHPYSWFTNATVAGMWYPGYTNGYAMAYLNPTKSIRSVMVANGDSAKKMHITEHGAPTAIPGHAFYPPGAVGSVSEQVQADHAQQVIDSWKQQSFAGDYYLFEFRNENEANASEQGYFGIVRSDYTPKIAYQTYVNAITQTQSGSDYDTTVLATSGLLSYWKMDESSGNLSDSRGAVTLTANGTPGYGGASMVGSTGAKSITFSGDDYFTGGDVYPFEGNTSFSVELLINPTTLASATFYELVTVRDGTYTWAVYLEKTAGGPVNVKLERYVPGGTGASGSSVSAIAVGLDARILVSYDATAGYKVRVNGAALTGTGGGTTTMPAMGAAVFRVGGGGGFANNFIGRISRVAIYDRVLLDAEDTAHQAAVALSVTGPGPYGGGVTDTGNRADEAALLAPWVTVPGAAGGAAIVSRQFTGRSGAYGESYRGSVGPDVEAWVTVVAKPADADPLYLRLATSITSSTSWNGYEFEFDADAAGTDTFKINRQSGGTSTQLGTTVNQEVTVGDSIALALNGAEVELWRRPANSSVWSLLATRTDSTHRSGGTAAWLKIKNQVARLDDFGLATVDSVPAFVGLLGDVAATAAWPTGGVLGDQPGSTLYGTTGILLGDAPPDSRYPPGS